MIEQLHPIVVHFPIALLTIYGLLELISIFPKVRHNRTIWYIKLFLLLIGLVSVQAALFTGEAAGDAGYGVKSIIERHERFANITLWIYGVALIGYLCQWFLYDGITKSWGQKIIGTRFHRFLTGFVYFMRRYGIYYLLALAGIIALTVTGALGGAMVYGTKADPVVKIVADLLHIQQ